MSEDHNWKFAQCFGDKGDSDDITDGKENDYSAWPHFSFSHCFFFFLFVS